MVLSCRELCRSQGLPVAREKASFEATGPEGNPKAGALCLCNQLRSIYSQASSRLEGVSALGVGRGTLGVANG